MNRIVITPMAWILLVAGACWTVTAQGQDPATQPETSQTEPTQPEPTQPETTQPEPDTPSDTDSPTATDTPAENETPSDGDTPADGETPPEVAGPPPPPSEVMAGDSPSDDGGVIVVSWELSPDDKPGEDQKVEGYEVLRSSGEEDEFLQLSTVAAQTSGLTDARCENGVPYYYRVVAIGIDGARSAEVTTQEPAVAKIQLIDSKRIAFGILLLLFSGSIVFFIFLARGGRPLKVRKIAGLAAVDEAVGRATETGRSVLFVPGIQDMNDIQTVTGIAILARVARTAAEYDATVEVPTSRSLVMTAARETVQTAFLEAGRPDAYNEDQVYYVTDEQFGYVAAVSGTMVREKPAACFYMGSFFAESLILAETGNSIGAIQVAGTAQPAQLPFFVAACDYTLIGEEFFAASAYLSGQPDQLGSLKGQDAGKLLAAGFIVLGTLLATIQVLVAWKAEGSGLANALTQMKDILTEHILK
jgi:hypothetical protein